MRRPPRKMGNSASAAEDGDGTNAGELDGLPAATLGLVLTRLAQHEPGLAKEVERQLVDLVLAVHPDGLLPEMRLWADDDDWACYWCV